MKGMWCILVKISQRYIITAIISVNSSCKGVMLKSFTWNPIHLWHLQKPHFLGQEKSTGWSHQPRPTQCSSHKPDLHSKSHTFPPPPPPPPSLSLLAPPAAWMWTMYLSQHSPIWKELHCSINIINVLQVDKKKEKKKKQKLCLKGISSHIFMEYWVSYGLEQHWFQFVFLGRWAPHLF